LDAFEKLEPSVVNAPSMKFIDGEPMNPATNILSGRS